MSAARELQQLTSVRFRDSSVTEQLRLAESAAATEELECRRRERAFVLRFAATLTLACYPLDLLSTSGWSLPSLVVRLALASALLLLARATTAVTPDRLRRLMHLSAVVVSLGWTGIVATTGGTTSTLGQWTYALVLTFSVLVPDDRRAILVGSLATIAGSLLLMLLEGRPAVDALLFIGLGLASASVSLRGATVYARLRSAERGATRGKAEAIAELARSERQRSQNERLAVVGRLAAGVAHEVNNPLAFVKSNLVWLRTELRGPTAPDPAEVDELLAESLVGVERIRGIVSDLRAFARNEVDDVHLLAAAEVVEEAVRLASVRLKGLARVELSLPPGLPDVMVSRQRLVQVLVNLLINAGDALEERTAGTDAWIRVVAVQDGDVVRLSVEDNGPGIPPEIEGKLFEPFLTTKPPGKGTGLGLAVSRELIERIGGRLEAGRGSEGGALFTLELPLRGPIQPVPRRSSARASQP